MKLSQTTLNILANFASIQPNIVLSAGSSIKTIAESKTILATATVAEQFPRAVGIYDLNSFLSAIDLIENAELTFKDDSILIGNDKTTIVYYDAKADLLTSPRKDVSMPKCELLVKITNAQLAQAKSAARMFNHKNLYLEGSKGVVTLVSTDHANKTAHKFSLVLDSSNACTATFSFVFDLKNLKMLPGTYNVSVSSSKISQFNHDELPLTYFIAVEKDSTYES